MAAIEITNLSVLGYDGWFKKYNILKGLHLTVGENQIFGFVGLNGAGKTTTINTILGNKKIKTGAIKIFGESVNNDTFKKIGYAPDEAVFYGHLTGKEHLDFFGQLGGGEKKVIDKRGKKLLERLGLEFAQDRTVDKYSKGMKQRLSVAISLINEPELLIRDEPMNGLDPLGRKLIKEIMLEQKRLGKTIFFSTHILSDVQELSDEFTIIHEGKTLLTEKPENIKGNLEDFFVEKIKSYKKIL